jgi:hypothetical protein
MIKKSQKISIRYKYLILHKYFMNANVVKKNFFNILGEIDLENQIQVYEAGQLQNIWYSLLYVVIEGYSIELNLSDPAINFVLKNKKELIEKMKKFRNTIFHVQKSYNDPREIDFYKLDTTKETVEGIREIHDIFSTRLLTLIREV